MNAVPDSVAFLTGDDAANLHGAVLSVDGGWGGRLAAPAMTESTREARTRSSL